MFWQNRVGTVFAAFLLSLAAPALGATPPPLDAYGDLPGVEDVAISPSGKGMAILGRAGGQRQLIVIDGDHKVRATVPASNAKIRRIEWAGEDAVIVETSVTATLNPIFLADKAEIYGALVVPLDGAKPWMVFGQNDRRAKAIFGSYGNRLLGGRWTGFFGGLEFASTSIGFDIIGSNYVLVGVDLKTGSTRPVARLSAQDHRRDWLVDGNGQVAATFDIGETSGHWEITSPAARTLVSGSSPAGRVSMLCFGKDGSTVVYAVEDDASGKDRWYEVPLAGGTPTEILADVGIERLYIDHSNSRMLGYLERGDAPQMIFYDPAKQAIARKIARAFPKLDVTLEDWTPDFGTLVVRTSGNGDSGSWYVVDLANRKADVIGSERPVILPDLVGPVSSVTYKAVDGLEMDGVLTLPPGRPAKNLPVVVFPHGGPTSHDEVTFDWWAQAFASRGYAVFQPNFRGSDNRGAAFEKAGHGQWGRKMQTDVSDGLAELARLGIVDPKRACIMGASYGGYAALAGVTLQKGLYRCAVSVGGVSDLSDLYNQRTYISGDSNLTWKSLQESLGAPSTFGEVSPRRHAGQADAPILLIHGKDDTVVPFQHSDSMASALKSAGKPFEMVVLQHEDHWLSRAETRKQMLAAAMAFVTKYNPAD